MGADSMFEILLNSLGIRLYMWYERTTTEFCILNDIVGEMVPGIQKGDFAENFGQDTRKLVSSAALEAKTYSAVGFDETFGATVMLTASEIEWGEKNTGFCNYC